MEYYNGIFNLTIKRKIPLSIPLHGIQIFHYMEFKHSTTWNSSIPLHGIQVFHYMEFKLAEWIRKFHHMKLMVPFTAN